MRYFKTTIVGIIIVLILSQFSLSLIKGTEKKKILEKSDIPSRSVSWEESGSRSSPETDVPTWTVGDWWEYDTTLNNTWPESGEFLTLDGTLRYTVRRIEKFLAADGNSYLAYNLSVTGGYIGNARYGGTDLIVNGHRFSKESTTPGETSGYRILRVSDLAILKEHTFIEGFVHSDTFGLKFNLTESMFDLWIVDVFDLPLKPAEIFSFSTQQNRSFSLYLSEMGYYLKRYSKVFPFSYEMTTSAKTRSITPAGSFDIYRFSGSSLIPDDPSTMNHSYSPVVKSYVKQDLYRITVTDDENNSVLDTTMELIGYHLNEITNTIDTNTDLALFNMPVKVNGSFPGHSLEGVMVTFPYTGIIVETTMDVNGLYTAEITTPGIYDNSPCDQDLSSFGVCAYLKNDMNVIITKSIVIVESDDEPPRADAGSDRIVNEDETVTFWGNDSEDDLAIKNYSWSFYHNNSPIDLFGKNPSFLFTHSGTYTVILNVSDYGNNTDTDACEIMVIDTTSPVTVLPDEIIVNEGESVVFNGSGCFDPELGTISGYEWMFVYNKTNVTLSGEHALYIFEIPGVYTVTLNITDLAGNFAIDSIIVRVNDITPPTAEAGPDEIRPQGTLVEFNGSSSADNVEVVSWTWKFVYEGTEQILFGERVTFTFWTAGNYHVTLNVTDPSGLKGTNDLWINITDTTPPIAKGSQNLTVDQGTLVVFDGSGSTDNVGVSNYTWTFTHKGYEQILYGAKISYRFENVGTYEVTLTVSDEVGNIADDTFCVTVSDVTPPVPPAGLDLNREINESEGVYREAGDWSDNGSTSLTYGWLFVYNEELRNISGRKLNFEFEIPGNYEITLTVKNDFGLSTLIKFHINVIDTSPETPIGKITLEEGNVLDIWVPDDFAGMKIETYHWSLEDSKGNEIHSETTGSTRYYYIEDLEPGTYRITLTGEAKDGTMVRQTFSVEIMGMAKGTEAKGVELSTNICFGMAGIAVLIIIIIILVIILMSRRGRKPEEELRRAAAVEVEPIEVMVIEYLCPRCETVLDEDDEVCPHCEENLHEPAG